MVSLPFPPLDFWIHESWAWEKQHHILDTDSEHIQPSGEPCLHSERYWHLAGTVTESSKGHSTILSRQLLQGGGKHGKTSEFYEHGPIAVFLFL